jgi:hypothetical protein
LFPTRLSLSLTTEPSETQTTKAGGDGFFRFTGLAPGTYRLTTPAPNFNRQVTEDVIVDAEETRGINITLQPGDVAQTVSGVTRSAARIIFRRT